MLKKEILKLILIIFSIIILLALFILVFSWVCYNLPIDFPGTVGDWISGLSALTGGALTLGGVWWTIRDNENKRREDLAIQYRPILKISNFTDTIPNYKQYVTLNFNKNNEVDDDENYYAIEFFNIGRGILCNFAIDKIIFEPIILNQFKYNHEILCQIAPQDNLYLKINLPRTIVLKENQSTFDKMNIILSLKGTDELNLNHFRYLLELKLTVSLKKTSTESHSSKYMLTYTSKSLNIVDLEKTV